MISITYKIGGKNMKNIVCIIARTNSKRLPHKTVLDIGGKKTIEHIIDSMKELKYADKVYLCTSIDEEDKILLEIARENGIEAYAGSRDSVIDRMLDVAEMENADNLLRVTGDNIFTDSIMLDFALKEHMEKGADYTRVEMLPIGVTGEVMKVSAVKDCYSKIDPDKSEYLAVYMFNPDDYKCLTVLPPEKFILPYQTLTVDTPQDWERTQFIFDHISEKKIYFGDIVTLSEKTDIPHYDMEKDGLVKLPNDESITYGEFREMYESRIKKSIQLTMEEGYYDSERNKRR
ncbi:MAG: hypothetical protein HDR16_08435 [Lachnospiraceae bacterium]|nr:hypothetical protein [Lachnospiraceae bacterium]